MPAEEVAGRVSRNCLHGKPLPGALRVLWDVFDAGDAFVRKTCSLTLLTSLDALEEGYGPGLEKESSDIAANVRAHRRLFGRLGFFAESEDGGFWAFDLGSPEAHDPPVVELDSEGQYGWLGVHLAEALYRRAEEGNEGAAARDWLEEHGMKLGTPGEVGASTQFLPSLAALHERYYDEQLGQARRLLPDADVPALPGDPLTWLLRPGSEVRGALGALLGLTSGEALKTQWVECDGGGRVSTIWLPRVAATAPLKVCGIGFGTAERRLRAVLGPPSKEGPGWVRYDSPARAVHFAFRNGEVEKITLMAGGKAP